MQATYDTTTLTGLLKQIGSIEGVKVIRQIDRRLQSGIGSAAVDILHGYEEVFVGAARALRRNGRLTDTDCISLRTVFPVVRS